MKSDEILKYCLENLEGSVLVESWGEKGIFYNMRKRNLPKGAKAHETQRLL